MLRKLDLLASVSTSTNKKIDLYHRRQRYQVPMKSCVGLEKLRFATRLGCFFFVVLLLR